MKSLIHWTFGLAAFALLAAGPSIVSAQGSLGAAGMGQDSVLTIGTNGSCQVVSVTTEPRSAAEQQVHFLERYGQMEEGDGSEAGAAPTVSATNAPAPLTDDELARKLTGLMKDQAENNGGNTDQKFSVEVKKDTVIVTTTQDFSSIEDLLRDGDSVWRQSGAVFENIRFETDTNGLLRVTLTPRSGMERYLKTLRSEWKLTGMTTELKLVFPGDVVSSGLPETRSNATWMAVDPKQDATLDALTKLYNAPTVILANAGGFKLAQPLESKNLRSARRNGQNVGADLPLTEAGPGYVAEAQSVATTTLHLFPGGEEYFKDQDGGAMRRPGTVVTAKLFVPRGRTLLSLSGVRVLTAVDDKGRAIAPAADESEDFSSQFSSGDNSQMESMQVQLGLKLPQPDAQSIDRLSAEAVVVTAGSWKELTLTNLQQNPTNALDLSGLLPGAKLVISKLSVKGNQFSLQARLQGPRAIRTLTLRAKLPGNDNFNSYSSERRFNLQGAEATRLISLQGFGFSGDDAPSWGSLALVVRYPDDLRRDHVKFSLTGVDLY